VLLHNNIGSNCRTDLEPIEGDRSAQAGKKSSQNPQGSWAEAGEPPRRELEWATFLKKGEPTGKWEVLKCNLAKAAKDGGGAVGGQDEGRGRLVNGKARHRSDDG